MTKRLQVLLRQDEYTEVLNTARGNRMTVAEWVRQALRRAKENPAANALHESHAAYYTHVAGEYYTNNMTKRLQVMLEEEELTEIRDVARGATDDSRGVGAAGTPDGAPPPARCHGRQAPRHCRGLSPRLSDG